MSRVGKLPIPIPSGITVTVNGSDVAVKGPKGTLTQKVLDGIQVNVEGSEVVLTRPTDHKRHRSLHGLYRALINNMIQGVNTGFKMEQELVGVGYRATNQ